MPAGRPGTRGAPAEATEPPDARDPAPRLPRPSGGRRGYLDMKIHLEKNLEEERQILLQQQKISRSRAHKYFVESNRRRKAFEEKRKEQEEREQQIREQILQQRKQKFEEVTEKFQRAHIPLSQRRRAVFQKTVPPLEEALKQIQEPSFKSEVYLPSSHRPTLSWRSIPACRAVSTPDPSLADPLPPARAPLIAHHPQVLPSYPALSPTRPSSSLPGHLSVPSARPQALLPAPFLSKPVKYLPRPPAPGAPNFSSSFPRLPAPVLSGPPDHIPHPPQSSPGTPEPDSQSRLFYKTFKPRYFLPSQRSTPTTLTPALIRRSLPTRLVMPPPSPVKALPTLKPPCLSSRPPHQPAPVPSFITPLPERPTSLDPFQPVQHSVPQKDTSAHLPQAFINRVPDSVPSHPLPCRSPSPSLSSSPSSSSSSPSIRFSSSSSSLSSPPSPSADPSGLPSLPLLSSPVHPSPSPCFPQAYLDFPSPVPPVSSSCMVSSSFPPLFYSPSVSTSPPPLVPLHPFTPPHWGKKVEKRREEKQVE